MLLKQYRVFSLVLYFLSTSFCLKSNTCRRLFDVFMLLFTLLWGLLSLPEVVHRHTSEAWFVELTEVIRMLPRSAWTDCKCRLSGQGQPGLTVSADSVGQGQPGLTASADSVAQISFDWLQSLTQLPGQPGLNASADSVAKVSLGWLQALTQWPRSAWAYCKRWFTGQGQPGLTASADSVAQVSLDWMQVLTQ